MSSIKKKCSKCAQVLSLRFFYKHNTGALGVHPDCKKCYVATQDLRKLRLVVSGKCKSCGWRDLDTNNLCRRCADTTNERSRRLRRQQKAEAIAHYGGKCSCCGEANRDFLTFDHINSDGVSQRKMFKITNIQYWLKKNNYPKDIQVLCYNCNCARDKNLLKVCPHKLAGLKGEDK